MIPITASQYAEDLIGRLNKLADKQQYAMYAAAYNDVARIIEADISIFLKATEEEARCSNCGGNLSDFCYDCTDKLWPPLNSLDSIGSIRPLAKSQKSSVLPTTFRLDKRCSFLELVLLAVTAALILMGSMAQVSCPLVWGAMPIPPCCHGSYCDSGSRIHRKGGSRDGSLHTRRTTKRSTPSSHRSDSSRLSHYTARWFSTPRPNHPEHAYAWRTTAMAMKEWEYSPASLDTPK